MSTQAIGQRARGWGGRIAAEIRRLAIVTHLARYETATSPTSLAKLTRDYEAGHWDYLGGIDQVPRYSMLIGYAEQLPHRTILDVGCGSGILRARMGHLDFEQYVGFDPVAPAIEQAQPLVDERTTFLLGDAFMPELEAFDVVVCNEVLDALPDPRRQLDRIRQLVRVDGHLLISNLRYPGDIGLYRLLGERFKRIESVDVSNRTSRGRRRRRIAVYRRLS